MDRRASDTGVGLDALVGAAGYSATRGRLMHLLLQCAVETLHYAQAQLERDWPFFCGKQGALLPGAKGKGTRASGPHPSENAITNELGAYVDCFMQSLPADHPYRGVVVFRYERPLPSAKLAGSKQKRQDFHYSIQFPDSPQFVIEAKPLFEPRDLTDRYLGERGIGRFTRHVEPYTDGELAAMLGYVQKGHADRWRARIRDAVEAHEGCELLLDVRISPDERQPATYSSRHARTHPRLAIWVLHLLLEYPPPLVS